MIFFDYPKTFLTVIVFLLFMLNFPKAKAQENNWIHCYDESSNRIYFLETEELKSNKPYHCNGETHFQGYQHYALIEDRSDSMGFFLGEPGAPMKIQLTNSGQNLLVTQWNNLTKSNLIIVLEPDLMNKSVRVHCAVRNFSDTFGIKVNEEGQFMVLINEPVTELSEEFHRIWKPCSL